MSELTKKSITELRVVDLRAELEKRGLDKSGNKQALIERLQNALNEDAAKADVNIKDEILANEEDILDDSFEKDIINAVNEETTTRLMQELEEDVKVHYNAPTEQNKTTTLLDASTPSVKNEPASATKEAVSCEEGTATIVTEKDKVAGAAEESESVKTDVAETASKSDGSQKSTNEVIATPTTAANDTKEKDSKTQEDEAVVTSSLDEKCFMKTIDEDSEKSNCSTTGKAASSSSKNIKERLVNEQNRNLWITNISQTTRASELKQALSAHGKVVGAKVVINARHPAACCYGYVKMETVEDADNCIAKLNNTELNGQIIRIEKVTPDHLNPIKSKTESKEKEKEKPSQRNPITAPSPPSNKGGSAKKDRPADNKERKPVEPPKSDKNDRNARGNIKHGEKKREDRRPDHGARSPRRISRSTGSRDSSRKRSLEVRDAKGSRDRSFAEKSLRENRDRDHRMRDMLTFDKIKDERERELRRVKERDLRNRRREESEALRLKQLERERRHEFHRLERERERIRKERETLARERAELMQLELERQKLEREKLEIERIALEQEKLHIQQERRAVKRVAPVSFRERERSYEERKRIAGDRHYEEAPPPPRFDATSVKTREPSPPSAAAKKYPPAMVPSSDKEYIKSRLSYEKRDGYTSKRESYPPKREYEERPRAAQAPRGVPDVTAKYSSPASYSRERDSRTTSAVAPSSNGKFSSSEGKVRYSERDRGRSPPYSRPAVRERDVRRREPESKESLRTSRSGHGYPEQRDSMRYDRGSSGAASWSPPKPFSSSGGSASKWSKEGWRSENPSSSDRWNSSSGFSSSGSNLGVAPACPPPPGINASYMNDRFDYKSSASMRKY